MAYTEHESLPLRSQFVAFTSHEGMTEEFYRYREANEFQYRLLSSNDRVIGMTRLLDGSVDDVIDAKVGATSLAISCLSELPNSAVSRSEVSRSLDEPWELIDVLLGQAKFSGRVRYLSQGSWGTYVLFPSGRHLWIAGTEPLLNGISVHFIDEPKAPLD